MRKTTLATQPLLSGPCKEFKFSVMKKENFGPVMLKEIFYYILKVSKFTRICMECNKSPYPPLQLYQKNKWLLKNPISDDIRSEKRLEDSTHVTVPLAPSASPSSQAQAIVRPVVNIIVPNNRADELSTEGQYNMLTRGEAICMPIRTYVSEKMSKTNRKQWKKTKCRR